MGLPGQNFFHILRFSQGESVRHRTVKLLGNLNGVDQMEIMRVIEAPPYPALVVRQRKTHLAGRGEFSLEPSAGNAHSKSKQALFCRGMVSGHPALAKCMPAAFDNSGR